MKHIKVLSAIQAELNAPKGQTNKFGGYTYRSCEDILEALKPLLAKHESAVTLTDELINTEAGHIYIKAKATLLTADGDVNCEALAREPMDAKGMSPAQCTGAASSYARKYALNGLFSIDDNKDPDATNTHGKEQPDKTPDKPKAKKTRFAKQGELPNSHLSWRDYKIPFGKNQDVNLGKLEDRSLKWYIDNITEDKVEFRKYLDMAQADKFAEEQAERDEAMTPNKVSDDELPF
jgi:hypothetical protein